MAARTFSNGPSEAIVPASDAIVRSSSCRDGLASDSISCSQRPETGELRKLRATSPSLALGGVVGAPERWRQR